MQSVGGRHVGRIFRTLRFIVETAKQIISLRLDEPICIVHLCGCLDVSERKLRIAFRAVHGTSPYRYLRNLRMAEARRALLTTDPARATVGVSALPRVAKVELEAIARLP